MGSNREVFGNRVGVLLAMAGSAIGLGNMWRFPYLLGQNGGAAFLIIYLLLMAFVCLPIFIAEFMIGRRSRSNVFYSMVRLSGRKSWRIAGTFAVLAAVFILSFYCVVGGWSVKYLFESCTFSLDKVGDYGQHFESFVTSAKAPLVYTYIFLGLTGLIISLGVTRGIERFSKLMMTVLFIIIVLVGIRAITLPGAADGLRYLFVPNMKSIDGNVMAAALGQAFFSLSVGCGTILTYGSYVKDDENIMASSAIIAGMDTIFALLAGIAIIPAVYAVASMNGTVPQADAGPGLVFITLPDVFRQMPLGGVVAILFFLSLLLAALTSALSLMETFVAYLTEQHGLGRTPATVLSFLLYATLGTLCSLSQGVLSHVHILGLNIFDFMDKTSSNVFLTGGSLLLVLFAGWFMKRCDFMDELGNHGTAQTPKWLLRTVYFLVRYIAPAGIIAIIITSLL